jgi:FKBP-type peptidyl-prolyl cis-trans isomerase FklB
MNMRFLVITLLGLIAFPALGQETTEQPKKLPLKTTRDQASYAIGLNIGRDLKSNPVSFNTEALLQGIRDILADAEPSLDEQQCRAALQEFQQGMQAAAGQRSRTLGAKNKRDGEAFLAANKAKEGVVTLSSGLQYEVINSGNGKSPTGSDTVRTHYHGTLIDGTIFDSSVQRKEPISFAVGGVIRGWTEALKLMKVGDKWRLFVPPELAYGQRGAGDVIGPNATLIFEVELLGIE